MANHVNSINPYTAIRNETTAAMVIFPKHEYPIKLDPFWQLQYTLKLWGQREDLMKLCLLILFLKVFGFTTRTIFILNTLNNIEMLLEVSATYSIPLLAVTKMILLLYRRKNVTFLFDAVTYKFWDFTVAGQRLDNYLQNRYKFINYLLLGHVLTSTFYIFLHIVFAEVPIPEGRTRWLPILIYLGSINQDKSPLHEILYVIFTWNMLMSVGGNGFLDCLFVYGSQHLCGQFMLLKELLRKLDYGLMEHCDDFEKFRSKKFQKEIRSRLAICVRHHNLLIRYANELKNLTSTVFGLQLLTTLLSLVLTGFVLSTSLEELAKSTMLLSFVFSSTMQFVIFAVQSADILHESSSVAEAAYQCNWHLFNAKTKRGLTLLIMNSQKGMSMTGAGLVEINSEVIVKMGQKVFSFITLLRSLNE